NSWSAFRSVSRSSVSLARASRCARSARPRWSSRVRSPSESAPTRAYTESNSASASATADRAFPRSWSHLPVPAPLDSLQAAPVRQSWADPPAPRRGGRNPGRERLDLAREPRDPLPPVRDRPDGLEVLGLHLGQGRLRRGEFLRRQSGGAGGVLDRGREFVLVSGSTLGLPVQLVWVGAVVHRDLGCQGACPVRRDPRRRPRTL